MHNLTLNAERQHRECVTILRIAQHNKFPPKILYKLRYQIQHKTRYATPHRDMNNNKKWATFIFIYPHIRTITNLFKHTKVKVAFRCHKTLGRLIRLTKGRNTPPHKKWGIYQLTCNSCKLSYVGQTCRDLKIRFQEHIRNNDPPVSVCSTYSA
jgi:hypothetical protein